jgi:tripartite-type tricarboxylate transporter receptor subunit TctC
MRRIGFLATGLLSMVALATGAGAQPADQFYKGKTLVIYSGLSAGGAYSAYARLLERHIGKHIPGNPVTVMKVMEGANGLTLANWLYNVAPKDGLSIGIFHERIGLEPVVAPQGTMFDGRKFDWIGSAAKQTSVCFTREQSQVKTLADAQRIAIPVGASAAAGSDSVMPRMMNTMLGTKFQIIQGYGGADILLAIERGEVEGRCGFGWASLKTTRPDWAEQRKINLIAQFSYKPHPDLKDVPLMMDMVSKPEDKRALQLIFATQEMGRPFTAPPGTPPDRLAVLRKAFLAALEDPALVAEAQKQGLEIDPISGEEITQILVDLYDTPKEIVDRVNGFRTGRSDEKSIKK